MDYVILEDVHKSYLRRYGAPTLRAHHERIEPRRVDEALSGVSLRVASGEGVALMSTRRAGRSTLLALIAGLYRPDRGRVLVHGRATGTIAMGAGFTSAVPVQHNMAVSAELLGMTSDELAERRDDILAFAGLTPRDLTYPMRELDGPQRRRLAYALTLFAEPDVFLADNLVVFGDKAFREGSLARLAALRERGHALVIATHKPPLMRELCSRAVVLHRGEIVFDGGFRQARRTLQQLRGSKGASDA